MPKAIGILTAGGDTPGLNAAIRAIGKGAIFKHQWTVIAFLDGFLGLAKNNRKQLTPDTLSGILTVGGTILGTSREKPHNMNIGGDKIDMTDVIVENYHKNHLDVLVCLGGGGTQKNALRLQEKGLNIITLPKTIDNDVYGTDITFGFHTAMGIATEAIDRLHSTASSHHRIMVTEIMGHRSGWLALGAGIAGGADVILLPEIPYDVNIVADSIIKRARGDFRFSIVAVSEGACSTATHTKVQKLKEQRVLAKGRKEKLRIDEQIAEAEKQDTTIRLAGRLEELTHLEARVTILGHIQRGGIPSAFDRLLASKLGTACVETIQKEEYGVMISVDNNNQVKNTPLSEVAGKKKCVPLDHDWVKTARSVRTCLGDTAAY